MRIFIATILLLIHFSDYIPQEEQSLAPKRVLHNYVKVCTIVST